MGALGDKVIVAMAIVLVLMSFVSTFLIYSFVNNVPTAAPSEGSGKVSLTIMPNAEPVTGAGVVSLNIKPLEK